ncbi:hypothetical protein GCK32_001300, partial [Trichostrongylus colubriformis]
EVPIDRYLRESEEEMLLIIMSMMTITILSSYMYCMKKKPKEMTPSMRSQVVAALPAASGVEGSASNPSGDVKPAEVAPPAAK